MSFNFFSPHPKKVGIYFPQVFLLAQESWKQHVFKFFLIAQKCLKQCFPSVFSLFPLKVGRISFSFCYLNQTNCKCNYHTITMTTAPILFYNISKWKILLYEKFANYILEASNNVMGVHGAISSIFPSKIFNHILWLKGIDNNKVNS